jgi:hypothetical protein
MLQNGRIVTKTKDCYQSKINQMKDYWRKHSSRTFKIPLAVDTVISFFGSLSTPKDERYLAVSTISSFKSALKWLYKQSKSQISLELEGEIDQILQGYRRKVTDLKQAGKMNVDEGKPTNII